jgi:hypothetical protein
VAGTKRVFPEEFGIFSPILCAPRDKATSSDSDFRRKARFSRMFSRFRIGRSGEPVASRRRALANGAEVRRATKRENRPFSRMFCRF